MSLHQHTTLKVEKREALTRGGMRALRLSGQVPAIVYGEGGEPVPISLSFKEVMMLHEKGQLLSHMFFLDLHGKKQKAVSSQIQVEPLKGNIIHIDFRRATSDTMLEVDVPLVFENQENCEALTMHNGVLNITAHSLKLLCPAEDIPEYISVDVSSLAIGSVIHIHDIALPSHVKSVSTTDKTVATISIPREEVEEKPVVPASEVETIKDSSASEDDAASEGASKEKDKKH